MLLFPQQKLPARLAGSDDLPMTPGFTLRSEPVLVAQRELPFFLSLTPSTSHFLLSTRS
jgi:hypothetical protein